MKNLVIVTAVGVVLLGSVMYLAWLDEWCVLNGALTLEGKTCPFGYDHRP